MARQETKLEFALAGVAIVGTIIWLFVSLLAVWFRWDWLVGE